MEYIINECPRNEDELIMYEMDEDEGELGPRVPLEGPYN